MVASAIAAIGVGIAGYGAVSASSAASKQETLQKNNAASNQRFSREVTAISMEQEKIRKETMLLESRRQAREIIRQTQLARSTALSRASGQGAQFSSALQGAFGSITSQSAEQGNRLFTNTQTSLRNFALNERLLKAQNENAQRTGEFNAALATTQSNAQLGSSLFSFGGTLVNNSTTLANNLNSIGGLFSKTSTT